MFIRLLHRLRFALIVGVLLPTKALSQDLDLGLTGGYGTYNLKALKAHRTELLAGFPVEMKVKEDFPAFYIFGSTFRYRLVKMPLAISFRFGSTGSRAGYSDYSGFVLLDEMIRFQSFGTEAGTMFHHSEKFDIEGLLRYWFTFTQLDISTDFKVGDRATEHTGIALQSRSSSFAPTVMAVYKTEFLKVLFDAGYEFYIPAKITLSNDNGLHLVNANNAKVMFDASGLRLNVSVAVRLLKDNY